MLVAEELFLLVQPGTVDDAEDPFSGTTYEVADRRRSWLALAGAVLVELVESGRVAFTEATEEVEGGRLLVVDETRSGHPALDGALARLKDVEGSLSQDAIPAMAEHLPTELFETLAAAGAVHQPAGETYYRLNPQAGAENTRRLEALRELVRDGSGDERTRLLHALLWAVDLDAFVIGTRADEARHIPTDIWITEELPKATAIGPSPQFPGGAGSL